MIIHGVHNSVIAALSLGVWPSAAEQLDAYPRATTGAAAVITTIGLVLVVQPGSSRRFRSRPHGKAPPS
jgi:hypothetical protein